jgi:hypothetical protein
MTDSGEASHLKLRWDWWKTVLLGLAHNHRCFVVHPNDIIGLDRYPFGKVEQSQ